MTPDLAMAHSRPPETGQNPQTSEHSGSTSAHLKKLSKEAAVRSSLSIAEMIETMGTSSIAFTILILGPPALTPIPGPFGMLFGSGLAVVSLQIVAGVRHLNLPGFAGNRRLSAGTIALVVRHTAPVIARVECLLWPRRLPGLTGPAAQRLLGLPICLLSVAIALPIPFGNILPVVALIVIAMALLERDGLAVLIGVAASAITLVVTSVLLYGLLSAAAFVG